MIKWHKNIVAVLSACIWGAALGLVATAEETRGLTGPSIAEVVKQITQSAEKKDYPIFKPLLRQVQGGETNLVAMIQRSGMATNFAERIKDSAETRARLDYHDSDRRCHFQVILKKENEQWFVSEFLFCR